MTAQRITDTYATILEVIDFVVSRTSDSLADILTKALPLVAPIPNAVSIYYVTQTALNYNGVQALAVAASVECMFFALTEVVLKSWELWHTDSQYKLPLIVSVSAFLLYFVLVMSLVYALEVTTGHSLAPMAFPVVSVVAAIALGVTRWHKRSVPAARKRVSVAVKAAQVVSDEVTVVSAPVDSVTVGSVSVGDSDKKLSVTARRERLSQVLGNVTATAEMVTAWAQEFGASERTIWRDIQSLTQTVSASGD